MSCYVGFYVRSFTHKAKDHYKICYSYNSTLIFWAPLAFAVPVTYPDRQKFRKMRCHLTIGDCDCHPFALIESRRFFVFFDFLRLFLTFMT